MQQDRNDIENIISQKEHEESPNLNQMENHWNKMQQMLLPNTIVSKINFVKKIVAYGIAAVLITVLLFFVNNYATKKEAPIAIKKNIETIKPNDILFDTALLKQQVNNNASVKNITGSKNKTSIAILNLKTKSTPFYNIPRDTSLFKNFDIQIDSTNKSANVSREVNQQLLNNFISSIQKRGELFTINNLRDTTIKAKEGTTFFFPMGSFLTKDSVVFEVKEFYKYEDMIANGLTTMANENQLISGGMLSLSAKVNGMEVDVNPLKEIRIFIPNLTANDSMEIFEGKQRDAKDSDLKEGNMIAQNNINWQLSKVRIDSAIIKMYLRAIDLTDDEIIYRITNNGKAKTVFFKAKNSALSKSELLGMIKEKHGNYYDIIRLKNLSWSNTVFRYSETTPLIYDYTGVGDTSDYSPRMIQIYNLKIIDTVYKIDRWINKGFVTTNRPSFSANTLNLIGEKYSIGINKLGWINCDKFYRYAGKKSNVTVNLNDNAYSYITYMVFENFKSIMQGYENGKMVMFPNIPMGEPVKIISIGIKDGKVISAIKNTITSTNMISDLPFQLTSQKDFKSSLSILKN